MGKIFLIAIALLLIGTSVYAVPALQLFIDGATYDWHSQTWVTQTGSFDLYVVSARYSEDDVVVSMALGQSDDPANMSLNFAGSQIDQDRWNYGTPAIDDRQFRLRHGGLPRHGIYPTWFAEVHTGAYNLDSRVGDVMPDFHGNFWNPANGRGPANAHGQARMFHVETGGNFSFVHFDAFTLDHNGRIDQFAPFSHDAEAASTLTPEPGTLALFGVGIFGIGGFVLRRRKS